MSFYPSRLAKTFFPFFYKSLEVVVVFINNSKDPSREVHARSLAAGLLEFNDIDVMFFLQRYPLLV